MENLPAELLTKLMNYLSLQDIIKFRTLNSKFNLIIKENLRLKELVINDKECLGKWAFTDNEYVNEKNLFSNSIDNPVYCKFNEKMYKNIKHLYIKAKKSKNSLNYLSDTTRLINQFKQLERLEIKNLIINDDEFIIDLPKLVNLYLKGIQNTTKIILNAPNLVNFKLILGSLKEFKINHPLSIRHCEVNFYQPFLISLLNLQYLLCLDSSNLILELFNQLIHLTEFHFAGRKAMLINLIQLINSNKKIKTKIYFYGIYLLN